MAISVSYSRESNDPTRARSITAYGSAGTAVLAAGTVGPVGSLAYVLSGANLTSLATAGQPGVGHVHITSNSSAQSGAFAAESQSDMVTFSGSAPGSLTPTPSAMTFLSGITTSASGQYVEDITGRVACFSGGSFTIVATNPIPHTGPYNALAAASSTVFYTLSQTTVEKLTLTTAVSGTWGSLTAPFVGILDRLFMNGVNPVVLGRQVTTFSDAAVSATEFTNQIVFITASNLKIYGFDAYGNITLSQTLAASGTPVDCAPALNQLLVTDTVSGKLWVYTSTAGTWAGPTQVLTGITNAAKLATSPDMGHALVCQGASNLVTPFNVTGATWAAAATLAITGAASVVFNSNTVATVGATGGFYLLSLAGSWTIGASAATATAVRAVALDSGNPSICYGTGTSAPSGYVYCLSGSTVTTATFSGSADDIVCLDEYVVVLDATNTRLLVYMQTNGNLTLMSTFALSAGTYTRIRAGNNGRIYALMGTAWFAVCLLHPFVLSNWYESTVAQWNGAAWVNAKLGQPVLTAGCTDGTFIYAVRYDNQFFKLNTSGAVQGGFPQTVPTYPGQLSSAYLGISKLIAQGSTIYGSLSLGGGIIAITGF